MADEPKHPGGRPKVDPGDASIMVTVTLPQRQYDAYAKTALRHDISVPEAIRRALKRGGPDDPPPR